MSSPFTPRMTGAGRVNLLSFHKAIVRPWSDPAVLRCVRRWSPDPGLAPSDHIHSAREFLSNSDGFDDPTALLNQLDIEEPTPAEAALLNEALERRFQALREPELRLIAQKKLEGYTSQSRSST